MSAERETRVGCWSEFGHHYAVISPVRWVSQPQPFGDYPDPGEQASYYVEVTAESRRAARIAACRTPEFADWVTEARGDNKPPMAGLLVEDTQCEHGICWGCANECAECEAEARQADQDEQESERVRRAIDACSRCNDLGMVWDPTVDGNVGFCGHTSPNARSPE